MCQEINIYAWNRSVRPAWQVDSLVNVEVAMFRVPKLGLHAGADHHNLNFDVSVALCAILSLRRSPAPILSADKVVKSCGSSDCSKP